MKYIKYTAIFFLILVIPITVFISQQQQENRQHAAGGNNYYVSVTGSDNNDGSSAHPFATIQKAANIATPGTTVHVLPGTYSPFANYASGTATARIVFVSDTKWGAKITTSSVGSATGGALVYNEGNYVDIQGFEVYGGNGFEGIKQEGSYDRTIGNHVHDIGNSGCNSPNGGAGIIDANYAAHDDDEIGNVVHDIGPVSPYCNLIHGIYHANANGHIYDNITYHNGAWGIHLWHADTNVVVMNNLVFENYGGGIVLGAGDAPGGVTTDNCFVANNILVHNLQRPAIFEYGSIGSNNQYINNLFYNNPQGTYQILNHSITSGTITADPQFVNYQPDGSGDYHLKSTSPAIDAGISTGAPTIDIDGNQRPQGKGFDIGPYEFGSSVLSPTVKPPSPTPFVTPTSITSLQHFTGGFSIDDTNKVTDAANDGIQVGLFYGTPPADTSSVGQAMAAKHMKIIDGYMSSHLYYYECQIHKTCSISYPNLTTVQALYTDITNHLQQVKNSSLVAGYWVLDDWNYEPGGAKDILVQINNLIHQITPGRPSICGFGGAITPLNNSYYQPFGWNDSTAANFSPQGCDMIGLYNYASSGTTGTYDWSMAKLLNAEFTSLKARGWDSTKTPLIGIPQAFGGMVGGESWPIPNAQSVETQSKTYCQFGATGIIYYAWDNSGTTATSHYPYNDVLITQGVKNGNADCQNIWNTTGISPTPAQGQTIFSLTICPHGLGNCGDNTNPTGKGNQSPLHLQRTATVTVLSSSNQPIAIEQGSISFDQTSGSFKGTLAAGSFTSGNYLIMVKVPGYLSKQLPGIQTITTNQTNTFPSISLTTGDINNDNKLDIIDYNLLIGCYGSKATTASCQNKTASDLTDDGTIDGADYNLFLRELSVQTGDGGTNPQLTPKPAISTTPTPAAQSSMAIPPGYSNLVFDDTFAGPTLDTTKWVPQIGDAQFFPWNNFGKLASPLSAIGNADSSHFDAEYDSPAALTIHNGLTITAKPDTSQPGYTWQSGVIDTHGKFTFTGGYLQVRAKMPDSRTGAWGGIWSLEGGCEIDTQESGFTDLGSNLVNQEMTSHMPGCTSNGQVYNAGVDLSAGYHIYGMEYVPGKSVKMFLDGHQTAQFTSNIPTGGMTIILNLAIAKSNASGWHTVLSSLTPSTLTMNVSEVQVWK